MNCRLACIARWVAVITLMPFPIVFGNLSQQQKPSIDSRSDSEDIGKFTGLGSFGRKVTTTCATAQQYFDQGLCFLYAFNHDEACRSFQQATLIDPDCAMAWWGIAMANGPHINRPLVTAEQAAIACGALEKAVAIIGVGNSEAGREVQSTKATPVEIALIRAAKARYSWPSPDDRRPLDEAFAEAMREVWKEFSDDPDVGAIFAEALMDLRPWDLWMPNGEPQPGTEEILKTLEATLKTKSQHPLALHLYIHALEASPHPDRARRAGERLRDLQPGLGHLVHMPSHIDVRLGNWEAAILSNRKAIDADQAYLEKSPQQDFYRIYMAHNRHMLAYAALMTGQSRLAEDMVTEMVQSMPTDWIKENAEMADGFTAIPLEVQVRFGQWDKILQAPEPHEYLPIARTMWHKSRAIAFATKGELENAINEQDAFVAARAAVAEEGIVGNNKAADVLAVAEQLMAGEILYRQGKVADSLAKLQTAVELEDKLRYDEPPDWLNPVRHALGAVLLQESRGAEAEAVFRADLVIHPNNGWALFGLARSFELQERMDEAAKAQASFDATWRHADIKIASPCLCQPGK